MVQQEKNADGIDRLHASILVLSKVSVEEAEYWHSPSGTMMKLAGFVSAAASGRR